MKPQSLPRIAETSTETADKMLFESAMSRHQGVTSQFSAGIEYRVQTGEAVVGIWDAAKRVGTIFGVLDEAAEKLVAFRNWKGKEDPDYEKYGAWLATGAYKKPAFLTEAVEELEEKNYWIVPLIDNPDGGSRESDELIKKHNGTWLHEKGKPYKVPRFKKEADAIAFSADIIEAGGKPEDPIARNTKADMQESVDELTEATNKEIVDAATFSGGRYKEHSHTTTAAHASRGIRVPDADKKVVMDRAERAMDDAGMKPVKDDPVSGAKRYESAKQSGEIFFNNGALHVSVKTK